MYTKCISLIPHKTFTFAKAWLQFANFLIRRNDLPKARKMLGAAIGMAPKPKLFQGYIQLELSLREFDRARKLYERFLCWNPSNCTAWIKYGQVERLLGDFDRARGILEIAVLQETLDMPEVLWKAYIDFEIGEREWDRARNLYERLLERTEHVKVLYSFLILRFGFRLQRSNWNAMTVVSKCLVPFMSEQRLHLSSVDPRKSAVF